MLLELRIRDLAIVEDLRLAFGAGFNAITGETGAGKSILVQALALVCGARSRPDVVRAGAEQAVVEALFTDADPEALEDLGLDPEPEVAVRRVVTATGRSRIHVNGTPVAAGQMARLAPRLVHVYGQHEQALLLDSQSHLHLLDRFAGLSELGGRMAALYGRLVAARRALAEAESARRRSTARVEFLEAALEEVRGLAPSAGEVDRLRRDRERLRNLHRILETGTEAERILYSSDEAVAAILARLERRLLELGSLESAFAESARLLAEARAQVEEAALQVRECVEELAADPPDLESVERRLADLRALARKHDVAEEELHELAARFEEELAGLASGQTDERRLREELAALEADALAVAAELSRSRAEAARRLERALAPELEELGMPGARIEVRVQTPRPLRVEVLSPAGADRVELYLAANPGEPPRPLSRAASGGELSRVLLAVKTQTAAMEGPPTLIFDEVDAGIGGTVAEAVARRLRRLARRHQILCITHLPQIAAHADHHYAVEKVRSGKRTVSRTRELSGEERIHEVRRMLGGSLAPREAGRYARELLRAAEGLATEEDTG